MENRWRDDEAEKCLAEYGARCGSDLALRTYSSRLLGCEPRLVLHGGGNTSVKSVWKNLLGEELPAIFVKASGFNLALIPPEGHAGLELGSLVRLKALRQLDPLQMVDELRRRLLDPASATPSIEALMHAFLPAKFVDHTHPAAILALTNQDSGAALVKEVLGPDIAVVSYARAGFDLALAAARALTESPAARALVLMHHGLVTWGESAKESYEATIELVSRAEHYMTAKRAKTAIVAPEAVERARERYVACAPVLRGLLAFPNEDPDRPHRRFILRPIITGGLLALLESDRGRELAVSASLTPDHLIRTKSYPLLIPDPDYQDLNRLKEQLTEGIKKYAEEYRGCFERHRGRLAPGLRSFDPHPRVVLLPGLGAVCAGEDVKAADVARDISAQALEIKGWFSETGLRYNGLDEAHLFDMEYFVLQHAKLGRESKAPHLTSEVALVTGAAGAIGMGICQKLLDAGCHVALSDLPGEHLDTAVKDLQQRFGARVIAVPLDVTDQASVRAGFEVVTREFGGLDIVVVNAGIAHVAPLADLDLAAFRKLERVNVEGTLLVLAEAGRHMRLQGTGGDIVVVSTKNVFAPGAKFGGYSATKAASHQLARIASLEFAEIGVRVNMVSPDAVFSHGARRSGLWAEVGPERMRARGLDEQGLEEYYRNRNLLKARVTAEHVGNAVLFFATRQTPTTGATIPVDGGLPDATPR